jgi:AcrR family transcriptional regulator
MPRTRPADPVTAPSSPAPRPPEQLSERGRRTRQALISAARQVFERDGFINARITDIAEEAGAAHGTFYTYFDSKEAALQAVILQLEAELLGSGAARYTGQDRDRDPVAALREANRRYLETYQANSKLMVIWENVATIIPEMGDLLHQAKTAFVDRAEKSIRGLQEVGLAEPTLDPRYAAHALTGMVSRFAYTWCAQGEDFELDKAVDELTNLWARALGLTPPSGRTEREGA